MIILIILIEKKKPNENTLKKLLEIRSRLSPEELRTIDDLVDQMLKVGTETSADKDGK